GLKTHDEKRMTKRSKDTQNSGTWKPLPGTQDEVQAIYNLIGKDKAELFTGKKAMKETLMYWGVPKVLHLATHGFFLENRPIDFKNNDGINRGFSPQPESDQLISPSPIYLNTENPLLRSGIVLAGANKISNTNDDTISDGIVTSEEILGMNLRGTEMVVLSACGTGLGEVKNGEGVFGLRRAFTQTGAKSLVMSMWEVPDKETKELMVNFYNNIYKKGMNRCQALGQAILKQMRITKQRYGNANPYYWGAFVFMGES
ncbi:MAG: CHAT domain-containing protein, partial [Desulfobacula sp.]|nr:CHAT domain-containing protein [Desulfobacula sp.]